MSNQNLLIKAVAKEIAFLNSEHKEAKQLYSLYRHNVNKNLGENPVLYGRILNILPQELHHEYAEEAAYTAISLYAFTGNQGEGRLTDAISRIPYNESIVRRFRNAETAKDISNLKHQLRGIVKLVKSQGESLDYALLAADLYRWQHANIDQIRIWERSLYASSQKFSIKESNDIFA